MPDAPQRQQENPSNLLQSSRGDRRKRDNRTGTFSACEPVVRTRDEPGHGGKVSFNRKDPSSRPRGSKTCRRCPPFASTKRVARGVSGCVDLLSFQGLWCPINNHGRETILFHVKQKGFYRTGNTVLSGGCRTTSPAAFFMFHVKHSSRSSCPNGASLRRSVGFSFSGVQALPPFPVWLECAFFPVVPCG